MIMETEEGFTIAEAALKPLADEERGQVGLEAGGILHRLQLGATSLGQDIVPQL